MPFVGINGENTRCQVPGQEFESLGRMFKGAECNASLTGDNTTGGTIELQLERFETQSSGGTPCLASHLLARSSIDDEARSRGEPAVTTAAIVETMANATPLLARSYIHDEAGSRGKPASTTVAIVETMANATPLLARSYIHDEAGSRGKPASTTAAASSFLLINGSVSNRK
jgi:hypothetical protein